MMKPTVYTIAQKAGVSIATVSRAFNNHSRISEKTKQRILSIAESMGYYPNAMARNLANSTTGTLALVLSRPSDPFFSEFISGIESVSRTNQYHLLIYTIQDLDQEDAVLSLLPTRNDGVILASYSSSGEYISKLHKQKFPLVLIGSSYPGITTDTVRPDNQTGAYRLTQHLIECHKYRQIAFISGPEEEIHSHERLAGYRQALEEHNIAYREEWNAHGNFDEASGYTCCMNLLDNPFPPRAIFAANDRMAIGAMAAANQLGLNVPNQIAIAGFDDISSAQYLCPPLTTISVATYEQGRRAAEQLLSRINNPALPPQDIVLPAPVILRSTCGCTPEKSHADDFQ